MASYNPPVVSVQFDTATVSTLEDALLEYDVPQAYRNALLMQFLLKAAKEPGLELQGQNLKLPGGVTPKSKMMGGRRASAFVNFEVGLTNQWVTGLEELNTQIGDGPTESWTDYAYLTALVAISGIDKIENTGPMKRLDILRSQQNKEIRGAVRLGETALWSTNTDTVRGSQPKWAGIQHKIRTDPTTTTLQGLDRAVFTPFRNQYTTTAGSFAANGLDKSRAMYFSCAGTNAMEPPHIILTTSTVASAMTKQLEGIHRVVGSLNGQDLSASKLPTFMGVPSAWTDDCPSGYQYWLNLDYIENIKHEGAQWTTYIPGQPNDQWIEGQLRWFYGAAPMMLTRPERLGVVSGWTA